MGKFAAKRQWQPPEPEVKPAPKPQWREILTVPVSTTSTVAVWYQGEKWGKDEFEALRLFIGLLDRFSDNSRRSENTDDEDGWWKELVRRGS